MTTVTKKSKVRERHARIVEKYKEWLEQNPTANRKRRIQTFDAYVDSAYLDQLIKNDADSGS